MPPPFTQQVTFLATSDLGSTASFYENVLGLKLALDQGSCRIYRVGPAAFVGFCEHLDVPTQPEGIIITLVTDAVDAWYAHLAGRGVRFAQPPAQNTTYNIYHCFLHDPNGYLLEIQQFLDPSWPAPAPST